MTIKLEVGKRYELNNGVGHACTKMRGDDPLAVSEAGYGPFKIDMCHYHQDGRFADADCDHPLSVKRCVSDEEAPRTVGATEYIEGMWYGWNGGKPPATPRSEVKLCCEDGIFEGTVDDFGDWACPTIYAFMITKIVNEPREFWLALDYDGSVVDFMSEKPNDAYGYFKVREVIE